MRKKIFYVNDYFRGGKIRHHYKDIEDFNDRSGSQEKLIEHRLNLLLDHAAKTTRYYRDYEGIFDLQTYPVMNKKQFRNSGDLLLSEVYSGEKLYTRKTSGSYGTPMRIYFTKEKMARQYAELIYYNKVAGLDIGEKYINITTNKKGFLEKIIKNLVVINPAVMDENWYVNAIETIKNHQGSFIIGFPSVLYPLSNIISEKFHNSDNFGMRGVITIAEPLQHNIKNKIENVFKCQVFNRYATMETGVLGHASGFDESININKASYIVEILEFDSDRHVDEGGEGRVVVTDLFSYSMPLIRYEIGDTAVLLTKSEYGAERIKNPEGRIIEAIFATNGSRISWAIIYDIMSSIPYVIQYQFIQTDEQSYKIKLVILDEYSQNNEDKLDRQLRKILGEDAELDFYYTDLIPSLPSGKRPMILNPYIRGKINSTVAE